MTGVALIPLSGQQEAKKAIEQAKASLRKVAKATSAHLASDSDTSEEEAEHSERGYISGIEHDDPTIPSTPEPKSPPRPDALDPGQKTTSVVEDVFGRKGQYGRFAEKWFSKKGWSVERRRTLGMSADVNEDNENSLVEPSSKEDKDKRQGSWDDHLASLEQQEQRDQMKVKNKSQPGPSSVADSLVPKLLRTTKMLLSSNSFYFSYEYDITRKLGLDQAKATIVPLYKSLDPLVGHHKFPILTPTKFIPVLVEPSFSFSTYRCWPVYVCCAPNARLHRSAGIQYQYGRQRVGSNNRRGQGECWRNY